MNKIFNLIKFFLACTLIFSGLVKGIDPYGTSLKVLEYCNQFGIEVTTDISMVLSIILCGVEIFIGFCLALNVYLKLMIYVALIILLLFTMMIGIMTISPVMRIADCGCFGDILPMSISASITKNILLIGVAVIMMYLINKGCVKFKQRSGVIFIVIVIALSACIPMYSAIMLPFIEFTEYQVGADLHNVKSFQLVDDEYTNVTQKILDADHQILIVKKKEFSSKESGIVKILVPFTTNGQYNVDVIIGLDAENSMNELYCSDNTLKMIARTPENAVIYLEKGIIKKKKKLWNIPNNLNN